MHFNPARCTGHVLTVILCPPALHKAHTNCAHFGELKNCFKSLIDTLCEELCKILIVEYFQGASRGDLANGGGMKMVGIVAVTTLDKDGSIAETLGKHFTSNVKQMNTFTNVTSNVLNGRIAIDVGKKSEAESIGIHTRICVAIDNNMCACGMESLANPLI